MKKQIIKFFILGLSKFIVAQNSAPSSHMLANDSGTGDILMKTVRSTITTNNTYYCTMQWNGGIEGGAYCGFQDSPDKGHIFIYSIWDPSNGKKITANYVGKGTVIENFGGEGTGLKSYNKSIGWDLNEWNTLVTRRWNVGSHTYFGFWIKRESQNKWYHMVTMDYPVGGVTFRGRTNAFLEDWTSTGANKRRFEMKEGFKRLTNGNWVSMSQGTFNRNDEPRSSNYTNANDAGASNGVFYMQTGGNTKPSYSGTPPITFTTKTQSVPKNPIIDFKITNISTNSISWSIPVSSTPQFKYQIKVNGRTVSTGINSEIRSKKISAKNGDTISIILEDILGRTNSKTAIVKQKNSRITNGTYKIINKRSKKALDAFGKKSGDNIGLWNYHGGTNQQWEISRLYGDTYKIIDKRSKKALDAFGKKNGDNVGLWGYHGGRNQQWEIKRLYGNTYKIIVKRCRKALDAFGKKNGDNIGLWGYHGGTNQQWEIRRVNSKEYRSINKKSRTSLDAFKIYFDQVNQSLNINSNTAFIHTIELINKFGKQVYHNTLLKTKNIHINTSEFFQGLYILRINNTLSKKLILH